MCVKFSRSTSFCILTCFFKESLQIRFKKQKGLNVDITLKMQKLLILDQYLITSMLLNSFNEMTLSTLLSSSFSSSPALKTFALTINSFPSSLVVSMPILIDSFVSRFIGWPRAISHSITFGKLKSSLQFDGVLVK